MSALFYGKPISTENGGCGREGRTDTEKSLFINGAGGGKDFIQGKNIHYYLKEESNRFCRMNQRIEGLEVKKGDIDYVWI